MTSIQFTTMSIPTVQQGQKSELGGLRASIPLTSGGKFGLSYAFSSYEDILDTRFPL